MIEYVSYTGFELKNQKQISNWLLSLANKEGFSIKNLYYNYVSPDQIQSLNNEFLKHDYVTDVLAFDYCEGSELSAEVFICQSEVEKNAKASLKMNPENPRAWYVLANNDFYKPKQYGGGKKVETYLNNAIKENEIRARERAASVTQEDRSTYAGSNLRSAGRFEKQTAMINPFAANSMILGGADTGVITEAAENKKREYGSTDRFEFRTQADMAADQYNSDIGMNNMNSLYEDTYLL